MASPRNVRTGERRARQPVAKRGGKAQKLLMVIRIAVTLGPMTTAGEEVGLVA